MSSSSRRKFLMRHPVLVDLGCGCRRAKLSSLFSSPQPKPKLKPHSTPKHHHPLSSYYPFSPSTTVATSPWETSHQPSSTSTATTSVYDEDTPSPSSHAAWVRKSKPETPKEAAATVGGKQRFRGRVGESVAVVKESDDPYVDFRESMLQMILEKEIYAWEDLRELLHRFLALNSPCHHDIIVRAFTEIWNGVFSSSSSAAPSSSSYSCGGAPGKQGRPRGVQHGGARRRQHRHHHVSRDDA